jgi:hypothetical protein
VNINPALPASWSMLEGLYRMTGRCAKRRLRPPQHVATLKRLPPEIVQATSLFSDGELTPAENLIRAYLLEHGNHIEAMRLLARIGIKRDVLDDAELLLEGVLELAPDYRAARHDYALVLWSGTSICGARGAREAAAVRAQEQTVLDALRDRLCRSRGTREERMPLYRELLVDTPQAPICTCRSRIA